MLGLPRLSLRGGGKKEAPDAGKAPSGESASPVAPATKAKAPAQPKPRDTRPFGERHPGLVHAFEVLGRVLYLVFVGWWCWPLENTLGPLMEWVESHPRAGFWSGLGVLLLGSCGQLAGALLAAQTKSAFPFVGAIVGFALLLVCLRCALLIRFPRKEERASAAEAPEVPSSS